MRGLLILLMYSFMVLSVVMGYSLEGMAQAGTENVTEIHRVYTAKKSKSQFSIDGKIDEWGWKQVKWASHFTQKGTAVEKKYDTKFKISFDDHHIYVALHCLDGKPDSIPMYPSPRDNNSNDWLEVDFDTNGDKETAYAFVVSPYGVRTDMYISGDDADFDDSYHPKWEVKTGLLDEGWTAEMKIPFDQMRIPESEKQVWGLQLTRHIARRDQYSNWQKMPKGQGGWVSQFGTLEGLSGIKGKQVDEEVYNPNKKYTVAELKEDFDVLTTTLQAVHPSLYWFSSKGKTDSLYQAIAGRLQKPLTEFEFYERLTPVFNVLGDGHSWIRLSQAYNRKWFERTQLFPVGVKLVDDQIFVTKDFGGEGKVMKGMEILSINGRASKDIISRLCQFVSADGYNQTWKIDNVSNNFSYYLSFILGGRDQFSIKAKTANGKLVISDIKGLVDDEWQKNALPPNPSNYRKNNWNYHVFNDSTAYLSINTFASGSRFRGYMDKVFAQIKKDGIQHLILDVRDNGGGNDSNGMYLYSYLSKKAFTYFKRYETKTPISTEFIDRYECCISMEEIDFIQAVSTVNKEGIQCLTNYDKSGFHKPTEKIAVQPNAFKGELYVLQNGGSFSVTSDFCSMVQDQRRGIIIGEESGGGYIGNTSGIDKILILPNTGLRTRINFIKFVNDRRAEKAIFGRGVMPEHLIQPNQSDIAEGIDSALEAALKLISDQKE